MASANGANYLGFKWQYYDFVVFVVVVVVVVVVVILIQHRRWSCLGRLSA